MLYTCRVAGTFKNGCEPNFLWHWDLYRTGISIARAIRVLDLSGRLIAQFFGQNWISSCFGAVGAIIRPFSPPTTNEN